MFKKCSFWVVFWGFLSPWGPRGVQVGQRWWQDTGILSHTMPQPSQVPLWALKSQIWAKIWPEMPPHFGHSCLAWTWFQPKIAFKNPPNQKLYYFWKLFAYWSTIDRHECYIPLKSSGFRAHRCKGVATFLFIIFFHNQWPKKNVWKIMASVKSKKSAKSCLK